MKGLLQKIKAMINEGTSRLETWRGAWRDFWSGKKWIDGSEKADWQLLLFNVLCHSKFFIGAGIALLILFIESVNFTWAILWVLEFFIVILIIRDIKILTNADS